MFCKIVRQNFKVRQCAEMYGEYRPLFEGVGSGPGDSTLEDKLYEYEVSADSRLRSDRPICVG